jgi:hypothetical protein
MGQPKLNSLGQSGPSGLLEDLLGTLVSGIGLDVPSELSFGPSLQVITPGETWSYQLCYRDCRSDGASSVDFSDAPGAVH